MMPIVNTTEYREASLRVFPTYRETYCRFKTWNKTPTTPTIWLYAYMGTIPKRILVRPFFKTKKFTHTKYF